MVFQCVQLYRGVERLVQVLRYYLRAFPIPTTFIKQEMATEKSTRLVIDRVKPLNYPLKYPLNYPLKVPLKVHLDEL